jgi:hypothetical protein
MSHPLCPSLVQSASWHFSEYGSTLLHTTIQVDSTIRYYKAMNGEVDLEFFVEALHNELVCDFSPHTLSIPPILTENM